MSLYSIYQTGGKITMQDYQEDGSRFGVKFRVTQGNQTFLCFVSAEALQDYFNASDRLGEAFESNREAIENKAVDKIEKGLLGSNGEVLVGKSDFQ